MPYTSVETDADKKLSEDLRILLSLVTSKEWNRLFQQKESNK